MRADCKILVPNPNYVKTVVRRYNSVFQNLVKKQISNHAYDYYSKHSQYIQAPVFSLFKFDAIGGHSLKPHVQEHYKYEKKKFFTTFIVRFLPMLLFELLDSAVSKLYQHHSTRLLNMFWILPQYNQIRIININPYLQKVLILSEI